MRVDVVKVLFVGALNEQSKFFDLAQSKGVIEFIHPEGRKSLAQDLEVHKFIAAIKVLRGLPTVTQLEGVPSDVAILTAERILKANTDLLKLQEEMRHLELMISRVNIFGNFSLEDLDYIRKTGRYLVRFFCRAQSKAFKPCDEDLIDVGAEGGMEYFIAIEREPKSYAGMIEIKIDHSLSELKEQLESVKARIKHEEQELKNDAKYNHFLHEELINRLDIVHLEKAKECTEEPIDGKIFAVYGWVPLTKLQDVNNLCEELNVYCEQVIIEKNDVIPTYLENKKLSKIGEDLVNIYDTPSISDHDPSKWVLWAFMFFFAMIINDAGYGLVFLLISLFLYFKVRNPSKLGKRIMKLSILLSSACIVWGTLTTSFFGMEVSANNPIRSISIVDYLAEKKAAYHMAQHDEVYKELIQAYPEVKNYKNAKQFLDYPQPSKSNPAKITYPIREEFAATIMFELALIVGTLHVISSFLRNLRRSWAGIGWIIFIIGGYLYFPHILHATSLIHFFLGVSNRIAEQEGILLLYGGIALAIVLAIIHKRLGGVLEFTVMIQIFCDILSYLRLYALGLAGVMMASTFNDLAAGAGIVFGTLIVLAGHIVNMAISIQGGVIHGLRLNFLEWYHYSFEGGGKIFTPLALIRDK